MNWLELSKVPSGARVTFATSWDIFAENTIVPAGTHATVIDNSLNEMQPTMFVRPDDAVLCEKLREWDGLVHVCPHILAHGGPDDPLWQEEGPLVVEGDREADRQESRRAADRIDGFDRDDLGESPDF